MKTELELVMDYKSGDDRMKSRILGQIIKRYEPWVKIQTRKIFKEIDRDYFAYDWDDCKSEVLYGLKLALDWFDKSKVSDKFRPELFSISFYAEQQISARIGTYRYKQHKKENRSVKSQSTEIKLNDEVSPLQYEDCTQNVEENILRKLIQEELDSKLTPIEKKIKDFLMAGVKESKIKKSLKINPNKFLSAKKRIGEVLTQMKLSPM